MKTRNKGKVYPSSSSSSSSPAPSDTLSVLNLLPAAILTLTIVLSLEDREVLAYMITRSIKSTNPTKKKTLISHKSPLFDCDCFDCYTSFWFKWDSSPNRERIHQAIEAFEETLTNGEMVKKKNKKKVKMGHRKLAGKSFGQSPQDDVAAVGDVGVVEVKDEENGNDPDDGNGGNEGGLTVVVEEEELPEMTAAAVAGGQHKGLTRKVLPDVIGLFNWRLWSLWSPN